ncbi:MAG: hypothetical protein K5656_07445 [Lachnospiraceae bacterium]|nr:hypothetical protein [Lachnospiraceae bacterium]
MSNLFDGTKRVGEDISFDGLFDFSSRDEVASSVIRDASLEGKATQAGIQTKSLQSAIDNYPNAMNQSAIAKSTGLPVRTPTQQYKGFAAEEYFKNTMKINALAKGVSNSKIGIYTKGQMPDGTVLSGIDMETDISIWTRKHPWDEPMRTADYQSKIHNKVSAYVKDMNNPQYQDVQFVGGSGQGVNDTVKVDIGGKTITSDSITPEEAAELAEQMKAQSTPEYSKRQEKIDELNKVNLGKAVKAGAATGFVLTTVQEIVGVIKNGKDLREDQFVQSIEHILCGTVEGGVRGGAIAGSVHLFGKMLGKEVASNSLEAIPIMATANVAVDFAKDLYKCFVTRTIDTDDLLCNSVNNVFSSVAGFAGAWAAGQIGGQIAGQFSSQVFLQGVGLFTSAKTAAATGAAIGSSLGPIGTVIGSVVGGILIGIGANAIIRIANKDAQKAYCECIADINSNIELSGCEKLYCFADSMESISEFRLSFKDLLPCYNLISDLREYNIHKKAIKVIAVQLEDDLSSIDVEKQKALWEIEEQHQKRIAELNAVFKEQRLVMQDDFRESVNTYVANSYMQYISVYEVLEGNVNSLVEELKNRKTEHSSVLDYMRHRNEVNEQINKTLHELIEEGDAELLMPFIEKITWFIQQDELMVGRQYISFDEALCLVDGGGAL